MGEITPFRKSLDAELRRMAAERENAAEVRADREGVTAEVSHTRHGWAVLAWAQRKWAGYWNAGGSVKKTW